jgi:Txe/YoeB family toxin of Txe-Axe toxin-antitoxin module
MLRLTWTENALEDLDWWRRHDPKMLKRIIHICLEICKEPHAGHQQARTFEIRFAGLLV